MEVGITRAQGRCQTLTSIWRVRWDRSLGGLNSPKIFLWSLLSNFGAHILALSVVWIVQYFVEVLTRCITTIPLKGCILKTGFVCLPATFFDYIACGSVQPGAYLLLCTSMPGIYSVGGCHLWILGACDRDLTDTRQSRGGGSLVLAGS
jgi:hypothetical protein